MDFEYVGNPHTHTPYSDGFGTHDEIAAAAIDADLDWVVITDHNVYVGGIEGYRYRGMRRVLLMVGEEIHDQDREPQKNHLLVFGAGRELAPLADSPQGLLDAVNEAGGLGFLAHIVDPASPTFDQGDLSWVNWEASGYAGVEIWNTMSEFKSLLRSRLAALYYGFQPERVVTEPFPEALGKWDELLVAGQRAVGIGGADAHAFRIRLGPLERVIFPYDFLFRCVNTHVLTEKALAGEAQADSTLIYAALRQGNCFVGYDLPASSRGFRFSAQGKDVRAGMGGSITARHGVTFQAWAPRPADIDLVHNGRRVAQVRGHQNLVYQTKTPGAYRVEAHLEHLGKRRGWIYSNPIFVVD